MDEAAAERIRMARGDKDDFYRRAAITAKQNSKGDSSSKSGGKSDKNSSKGSKDDKQGGGSSGTNWRV
ncbi:hypothetical protein QBC35DRAFT_455255 [Podospora australis]|uniref:Uncharacterized protein n=1 Tax=Podospora australis TaxID=1536484 RepID=A0AAN7AG13_9PEZI|nr:hypothetical protein QBC35DRAFT_455255 [Podospora australis]